jgi:glycosyltransferase involved in cell wall biosynthesis
VFLRSTPFEWPRPFVAWVASLKSDKRPEVFVELARRCQDLELDFLMVGRLVETHYRGVLDVAPANLHYLGEVEPPAVNGLLASSLMLVHTCKPEGFGNNFMQAWLQGKPTLTLEFDPDGLIEDRGLGYRTDTLDGLEQRVRELCFDEPLRAEMGRRARELVDADFDQVANGRRLLEFFEQLLAVRTGPELG